MLTTAWVLVLGLLPSALAVKHHDFKTCAQSGFCRRGRALSARATESAKTWKSPYSIVPSTVSTSDSLFTASVQSSLYPEIKFGLEVRVHADGVVRVRMDEVDGLRKRYDEAASWALVSEPELSTSIKWVTGKKDIRASYGDKVELRVEYQPLRVSLWRAGREEIVLNDRGLLHMEHFREKAKPEEKSEDVPPPTEGEGQTVLEVEKPKRASAWFEGDEEDDYWEESFNGFRDSKPKGPESLSLDINFPGSAHIYGIPEHATRLSLPTTTGPNPTYTDPYRLYNLDVFEFEADSPMALYGGIPLLHAHSAHSTVGIFNAIASETWVDVSHPTTQSTSTHWISESGILDVFLLPGPTPADVFGQYARLTGTPALPAHWSLGYHQCRWNYVSSNDIRDVQRKFDEYDMPFDVLWLDIEYSEEHKYFIWDNKHFPDPVEMVNDVAALERKMVVIVDPHLKRTSTYPVYQRASELGLLVKPPSGEGEFEGWCWSGSSSWVDFFHPGSWDFWKGLYKIDSNDGHWHWKDSTENVHIWNDMNEPSVFNGPEITMQKDNIHHGGWEHRDVHNINGMLYHNTTSQALLSRSNPAKRPFVLSRAFYAGSQRWGAIWTGDNQGTWEHMAVGIPMALSTGIAGLTFSGADVGGFFGNPEPEMLVRWYQVGAFAPFFRGHAHIDTKRREPYLLDEPYRTIVRDILRLRYSLLPIWYTAFREASVTGIPILRPHYVMFPKDVNGFAIEDQYYIGGSGLLVKPVTKPGVTETSVYLAEDQVYYDYFSHHVYRGSSKGKTVTVPSELHQVPLLLRGGSILPIRARPRRSSPLMKNDPFTLIVGLGKEGSAKGELYLDDGETFSYREGNVVWRGFEATKEKGSKQPLRLKSIDLVKAKGGAEVIDGVTLSAYDPSNELAKSLSQVKVEKIVIVGLDQKPSGVSAGGKVLSWTFEEGVGAAGKKEGGAGVLTIKNPGVGVTDDWEIHIEP